MEQRDRSNEVGEEEEELQDDDVVDRDDEG